MKIFIYIVIGVVVVAVAASFFMIGTPGGERLRRIDDVRVSHLSIIQSEIYNFLVRKDSLPTVLNELQNDINYFNVPTDPETNTQYEYKVLGEYQFELCANFVTESSFGMDGLRELYQSSAEWGHSIGRNCFTRTIDPELYKSDAHKTYLRAIPKPFF